ncbi:MAG TPA: phosphoribosyltransferase [Thermoplasmata archaeon]|nr:phosphoribosyltransferase [Thermoplasmata archaeon]
MNEFPRCRRSTWADLEAWSDDLARQIRAARAVPETLVALTRGGWVPARLLADRLGIRRLLAVRAQHWGVTARPDGQAELTEGLAHSVAGQHVLVIDDIADTGESLRLAVDHVRAAGPARLESATCLCIAHAKFRPTYVAEEIPKEGWVWIVFPWNFWEDLKVLGGRAMAEAGNDPRRAVDLLEERSGLKVTVGELERALAP